MRLIQYIAVLAGWTMMGSSMAEPTAPAAPATPVKPAQVDTMTMSQDARCRQVLVSCVMNGVPMRMMLDTGATNTVLHSGSLSKLKNPQKMDTSNINFSGNAKERPEVYLLNIKFADVSVRSHPVMALNLDAARNMMAEKIDGILGMDLLGVMTFTFDIANGKMHWGLPEGKLRLVPLSGERDAAGRMFPIVQSEGATHAILLDSGATVTRLPQSAWPAGAAHETALNVGDVNEQAALTVKVGAPATMQLAPGVSVEGVTPVFCSEEDRSMLGMDVISRVRLIHLPSAHNPAGYFYLAL